MFRPICFSLIALIACSDADKTGETDVNVDDSGDAVDEDGDGSPAGEDCDDQDAARSPGAIERCDGIDNDCDDAVDEDAEDAEAWYTDEDGDGYGLTGSGTLACEQPEGTVSVSGDCDDGDAAYNPAAVEDDCEDENDYNCDGSTGYADEDDDGWAACLECNDGDNAINPGAVELCDGVDNNCDSLTDGEDAADAQTWYADADSDGYGDPDSARTACEQPEGWVDDHGDCDDSSNLNYPSADERCDAMDNDCDGAIDEGVTSTWYLDADEDGFGSWELSTDDCEAPDGYVALSTDCDDEDGAAYPDADELCDGVDNDCDAAIDEDDSVDASIWYVDADEDGHGRADLTTTSCELPAGYASLSDDCDDDAPEAYPGATEVCDEQDNDCDDAVDEGVTSTWYLDADDDGYGRSGVTASSCTLPDGYAAADGDCDDARDSTYPGAPELCDDEDNDCDDEIDEGVTSSWYLDADGDGYGRDSTEVVACSAPTTLYVGDGGDCDDGDDAYFPGASEGCDGEDYDCDGEVDNDADGDGYADISCGGDDCDDDDASLYPEVGGGCALGESCADILARDPTAADGTYVIDVDGYGVGTDPYEVECDMTTSGGGWTMVLDWNREDDGDTAADLESLMVEEYNNMSLYSSSTSYLEWADNNATADVLSYRLDIEVPNSGDTLFQYHAYAYSMDDSGLFFYVEASGSEHDIRCHDDVTKSAYSTTEKTYIPGYTCSYTTSSATFTWDEVDVDSFSEEVDTFYMKSFMYDSYGDYVRLYSMSLGVR